ncbi:PP2C like protein phosphatase [Cryptosporidium ubiquitum]|uniref:PP2C like protein phosphatase n=1 Tax=Cryptosporidium ubiquitum TaxID=857276 RepID=A0A1J4MJB1_9CRYT|nr:PP2C like protein phosphatase [Cryptosporidium ubiquitum]OII72941.1 PP2C like protein phosphatase [Cryptosporidium ubiquitum]
MKFKIFTKSRSNSRIHTPKLIEEGFFDIYKKDLFKNQIITINAVLESDDYDLEEDDYDEEQIYNNNNDSDWEEGSPELWNKSNELKIEECSDNDCIENGLTSEEQSNELINLKCTDKILETRINKEPNIQSKKKEDNHKIECEENGLKNEFSEYKDLLNKMDLGLEADTIKVSKEDEIDQLRNSIFKKLDKLENEVTKIRNQNILSVIDQKLDKSNKEINVQDILSNIGKHFIEGVNNIIETGHSTIFKKYSLELNDIKNIIQEYNKDEMNRIINIIENQPEFEINGNISYETLNNVFQFDTPIKGIGYWFEQGMNNTMDDRWFISKLSSGSFFGILDSYNGDKITSQLENLLVSEFDVNIDNESCLNKYNLAKIFLKTILSIDKKVLTNSTKDSLNVGSGLISCFIFHSKLDNNYVLFSCNLGRCKGFLSRNNEILKFQNEDYHNNMISEMNFIQNENIANSAIGFGFYKPPFKNKFEVDNVPQVISIDLISEYDRFIVIATDSIWQVFQEEELNEMILSILNEIYSKYPTLNKQIISTIISHSIVTESLLRGVTDNQVCMVVLLN